MDTTKVRPIAEIESEFPDQWVLIADPEYADDISADVLSGRVLFATFDHEELLRANTEHRLRSSALYFTGEDAGGDEIFIL